MKQVVGPGHDVAFVTAIGGLFGKLSEVRQLEFDEISLE